MMIKHSCNDNFSCLVWNIDSHSKQLTTIFYDMFPNSIDDYI